MSHQLSMPFTVVTSAGGPYDDAAFVAGYACGHFQAELQALVAHQTLPRPRYVHTGHVPQFDLIAMKYGYSLRPGDIDEASGHQYIEFDYHGDFFAEDNA